MSEPTERTWVMFEEIAEERTRQDIKWGEQNHDDLRWLAILSEEVGETAKAILERTPTRYELIQVAAVLVAWLEALERRAVAEGDPRGGRRYGEGV